MKKAFSAKLISLLLCAFMLAGVASVATYAVAYTEDEDHYLKMVSKRDWELAPGITESEMILTREDGSQRQVCHVVEVDPYNPYTKVLPSYKGMAEGLKAGDYGTQIMSEQAKYAEEHGYGNVVAAMNTALHWYDVEYYEQHPELIGEPLGTLIMNGEYFRNSQNSFFGAYTCLVVNFDEKDGVPRPAHIPKTEVRQTYDAITGWEEQLIPASFHFLVKDGENQHIINDPEPAAPRSMLGIKADGTIITVMNEGRQEPFSRGFNCYEMAEFMISLGCVQAVNCDGGGSSTFLSQRPGEELELHCSPSDGSERPVAHGILIISTADDSHKHTPGEATDQAPTATEPGYAGRVFCVNCGAVLEEGRKIPATCHTYSVDVPGQRIVCGCGCTFTESGLQTVDGESYYTINGKLLNGWQTVDGEWYYFHKTTYAGLNGEQYADNGVKFTFEDGRLTSGVWVTTSAGTRYWYGPGYYRDSSSESTSSKPCEIDGKVYLFNRSGYMQTGITKFAGASGTFYYDCGIDGVATLLTGVYNDFFYLDGVMQKAYRLVQDREGNLYFVSDGHRIVKNANVYLNATYVAGKTFPDGRTIPVGSYRFDAEGKMVIPEMKQGVIGDFLYINDVKQLAYQLVAFEGDYYFINDGHKIARNVTVYLSDRFVSGKTFPNGSAIPVGRYSFDAEGKMILPEGVGPVPEHTHTEVTNPAKAPTCTEAGLTEGKYCAACGDVLTAQTVIPALGHTPGAWITVVEPSVGMAGKKQQSCTVCGVILGEESIPALPVPAVKNGVYGDFLYVNDVRQTCYKLVEYGGALYFINDGHRIARGVRIYLGTAYVSGKTFPDGRVIPVGYYEFDADGKMIVPTLKHGVVGDFLYVNDVKQTRYQLAEFEGNYYFINDGDKIAKNGKLYLSERFVAGMTFADGRPIQPGTYEFGADGKMIVPEVKHGVVGNFLYINDVKQLAYQLVELNGDYYFVSDSYMVAKNQRVYLSDRFVNGKTFPDGAPIPAGYYEFNADGKMMTK